MKCIQKEAILELDDVLNYFGLLCELARLNSEFLVVSFEKHTKSKSFTIIMSFGELDRIRIIVLFSKSKNHFYSSVIISIF